MDFQQISLIIILLTALIFFASDILRYDLVAALTLILATLLGVVPFTKAFTGFSHAAVITVGAIFVISRAVENTGILTELAANLTLRRKIIWKQIAILCAVVALLSGFINNVGAVALMIPITLKISRTRNIPRGLLLMPLAFSSLLGGLMTLIGTPPNIIISNYRAAHAAGPFGFFAFTPVGLGLTLIGIAFIAFLGWRLIPLKKKKKKKISHERFTVELKVKKNSPLAKSKLAYLINQYQERIQLIALIREDEAIHENLEYYKVKPDDLLILETDKWTLSLIIDEYKLALEPRQQKSSPGDHYLTELTLLPNSSLCNYNIVELDLQKKYGFEVVAISRGEKTITARLKETTLEPGDVLLIKSANQITYELATQIHSIIIEETRFRPFSLKQSLKVFTVFSIALLSIILGWVKTDVAFFSAAAILILLGCLRLDTAYRSINWPIIILIATLIPIGEAIESTGTAKLFAQAMYYYGQNLPISINLFVLMMITMLLSNLINNAAVALIFAPIAIQIAGDWNASADPFLMAVAVGASSTFLTPIGHQSNAMVLSPGNYRFADYWLMGLPLTCLLGIMGTIFIMLFWPFFPGMY